MLASSAARWPWSTARPPATTATTSRAGRAGEQAAQDAVLPALALDLALRGPAARVEEGPLSGVLLHRVFGGPVEGGRQSGAAVEVARFASAPLPVGDGADEVEPDRAPGGILREPALEPGPLPQQGLVGDLDVALARGQQAGGGEGGEDLGQDRVALDVELGERHPAADELGPLAGPCQPEEERPGDRLAVGVETGIGGLGQPRDRAVEAAARAIRGERQASLLARPPQLEQGG